jgi:DNA-binding transcriptional LysR family regulator
MGGDKERGGPIAVDGPKGLWTSIGVPAPPEGRDAEGSRETTMKIEHLRALDTVVRRGSFHRAAREVHLTQPAVTQQIKLLERELGLQLLTRRSGRIALTPAGESLMPFVRGVLEAEESLRQEVANLLGLRHGSLRIGLVNSAIRLLLPSVLSQFTRRHPTVEVQISEGGSSEILQCLRRGEIELAIVGRSRSQDIDGDLGVEVLAVSRVLLCLPPGHRLLRYERIPVRRLAGQRIVMYREGWILHDMAQEILADIPVAMVHYVDNEISLRQMVAAGLGVGFAAGFNPCLQLGTPGRNDGDGSMVLRPLDPPGPELFLCLVRRVDGTISPAARAFAAVLADELAMRHRQRSARSVSALEEPVAGQRQLDAVSSSILGLPSCASG